MSVTSVAHARPASAIDLSPKPNWIVPVSAHEAASQVFEPQTEAAAHAAFGTHGCVLLRGVFAPATAEAMHREFATQFGAIDLLRMREMAAQPAPNRLIQVGDARYDIALRMTGAFGHPEVFANGLIVSLLRPLLGNHMVLNSLTAVVSHPQSQQQRVHRDYPHLFDYGHNMPTHAVNVVVPLIDVDLPTGPTGVWLGSHLWDGNDASLDSITVSPLGRGDCMMMDYRLLHTGLPNRTAQPRPMLYLVYARPWFFDQHNHLRSARNPVDMPLEHYNELPATVRPLLARAYYYRMLARWHEAEVPPAPPANANGAGNERGTATASVTRGKASRNDPCPCGSGKRYKHCHGALV
jgi:Phytanoyl-CoA dioxygenase (PhyH)/SEC-C motif